MFKPKISQSSSTFSGTPRCSEPIPKTPIVLAIGLVLFSLIFVAGTKYTGVQSWEPEMGPILASRDFVWVLNPEDHSIMVLDAETGQTLETVTQKQGGFIHSAYRGIARERLTKRVSMNERIRIIKTENGRIWLVDPATSERIFVRAFGRNNEASLGRFLTIDSAHIVGEGQ